MTRTAADGAGRHPVLPRGGHYPGDLQADLLAAALAVLAERGPDALTLRAVAARVGVSHAAPARWYPTKSHLLTAVATHAFRELVAGMARALDDTVDPPAALQAAARAYLEFAHTHPGHFAVMWRDDLLLDDPDLRQAGDESLAQFLGAVEDAVRTGWAAGHDPEAVADLAWSTVHGLAVLRATGPYRALTDRQFRDRADAALATLSAALTERPRETR